MRKKLDTRFPAARIKKIMQADEDVGKIAMAVPLLVSKALELFLQDLCDRTYEITLRRGAKTMNSFHLKQCVQTFNVFDFLKDIVSKVPDLGGSAATADDRAVTKRRKVVEEDDNDSDDELKRSKMREPGHTTGRGRGRGRGRHRGRRSRSVDREMTAHNVKYEDDPDSLKQNGKHSSSDESSENGIEPEEVKQDVLTGTMAEVPVRNFDLNLDLDENGDSPAIPAPHVPASSSANLVTELPHVAASSTANPVTELLHVPVSSPANPVTELRHEEYPGWSLSDVEKMTIDPMQLANLNRRIEEDEEDYDEES